MANDPSDGINWDDENQPYVQKPSQDPNSLNPSLPPQQFLGQILDKTIGDEKAQGDEIQPTSSPVDWVAGGLGSSLGKAIAPAVESVGSNFLADEAGELRLVRPGDTAKSLAENQPTPALDPQKEITDKIKARFGDQVSDKTWSKFDNAAQNSDEPYLPIYQSGKTGKNLSFEPKANAKHVGFYPNLNASPTGEIGSLSKVESTIGDPDTMYAQDPLNWVDQKYGSSKALLQKHAEEEIPANVTTTSDLIAHDDYMEKLPKDSKVNLVMTQKFGNEGGLDRTSPAMPSNNRIMTAYQKLKEGGINANLYYANPDTKKLEIVNPFMMKSLTEGRKPVGYAMGGEVEEQHYYSGGVIDPNSNISWDNATPASAGNPDTSNVAWDSDKYGTPGQTALAAGEGLAQGVLGRAPVALAERAATSAGIPGLTPEAQAGREAESPYLHAAAETLGFVAPAIASLGTSAEARGALEAGSLLTQAGQINKVGEAAAGIGKIFGIGGEGASTISKIASGGIKTGAEMAALQANDEVAKYINQDANQSLGTAAINVGLSGIIGGVGGVAIGSVSPLWKASMEKIGAPKIIDDAKAQYNFRQSLPAGDIPAAITDEANTRLAEVDNMRTQMSNLKGASLARAMPEVTTENTAKINAQIEDISSKMTNNIEKASNDAYLKGAVPKLAQDFQNFLEVATNPEATYAQKFEAIDDLKRAQQAKAKYNLTPEDTALGQFTKGTARDLRMSLEDPKVWGDAADVQSKVNAAIKSSIDAEKDAASKFTTKSYVEGTRVADPGKINTLVNQSVKGKAGLKTNVMKNYLESTQDLADTINQIHTDAGLEAPVRLTPTPALDHTLGRSSPGTTLGNWMYDKGLASVAGHIGGDALGAGLGSLVGHPIMGALIGERLLAPAITSIAKPLLENATRSEAFKGSLDYAVNVIKGNKILSQAAENFFKSGAEIIPKQLLPTAESRQKAEKSLEYASNQDNMMNVGSGLSHLLPAHTTAAAAMAQNASNYFAQLKPKQVLQSPLDKPSPINPFQKAIYNRQLDIAQQPLLILKHAKDGTLKPQDMQTVNTLYPGLLKKVASESYDQMTKAVAAGKLIPYKQRLSLSLIMQQPMDTSLTQPMMATIMMANSPKGSQQAAQAPQGKQRKVSQSTAKFMNKVSDQYATPQQAREANRKEG